jgi:hypothetical protein
MSLQLRTPPARYQAHAYHHHNHHHRSRICSWRILAPRTGQRTDPATKSARRCLTLHPSPSPSVPQPHPSVNIACPSTHLACIHPDGTLTLRLTRALPQLRTESTSFDARHGPSMWCHRSTIPIAKRGSPRDLSDSLNPFPAYLYADV